MEETIEPLLLSSFASQEWDIASLLCQKLLILKPNKADIWNFISAIFSEKNQKEKSLYYLKRAIQASPFQHEYRYNLFKVFTNDPIDLKKCIIIDPPFADIYYDLAIHFGVTHHVNQAISLIKRSLILTLKSHYFQKKGAFYKSQKIYDLAEDSYKKALIIEPSTDKYWHDYALLKLLHSKEVALKLWFRLLSLNRNFSQAYTNIGTVLIEFNRLEEAKFYSQQALVLDKNDEVACLNLGLLFERDNNYDEAHSFYDRALILDPSQAEIYSNFGYLEKKRGRLIQGEQYCRRAIIIDPDLAAAHINLSVILLGLQKFTEGWQAYEWRWYEKGQDSENYRKNLTHWQGEEGRGGTLLIYAEQGLGDNIQFCRFIPLVKKRHWHIILKAPQSLIRLLKSLPDIDEFCSEGDDLPPYDAHCPMLSLPHALSIDGTTISCVTPYLKGEDADRQKWFLRIKQAGLTKPKIAIAWRGSSMDSRRSVEFSDIKSLLVDDRFHWFCSHKEQGGLELDTVINWMIDMKDMADMASFIENCDLVITIDTALVHLAGALGKEVWMMTIESPCWRWYPLDQESLWYPTLRQFRQNRQGDWSSVIKSIQEALNKKFFGNSDHDLR
jgi:tetratricopeptide (TPR) repeat protein